MGYEDRREPPEYGSLAREAAEVYRGHALADPAIGRARALLHVVERCPVTPEPDTVLLGGEDPFFFNLMLPALQQDGHAQHGQTPPDAASGRLRDEGVILAACFEGHITPGLDDILVHGLQGLRSRLREGLATLERSRSSTVDARGFHEAGLLSIDAVEAYVRRYRDEALRIAESAEPSFARELREAADVLARVPEEPARSFREALQAFWTVYVLVTLEMGGCTPGGGLGLGRLDQFLYPYYRRDTEAGVLSRAEALELLEVFLLGFRHVDYYTWHQIATPGSQSSLGGVTTTGEDASNELTELLLEASLRIAMPAPYLSLRLHRRAPERYWQAASSYVLGGLGFPIVNDEVLVPAMLRHGRSVEDARDYICSCCYENTIPGREAFHPNGSYLNLPLVLELALNSGRSLLTGERVGVDTPPAALLGSFEGLLTSFTRQLAFVCDGLVALVDQADRSHMERRRYPLMSLFIDDCIERGLDVCAGGARYNLTGCIVSGLPNVVNSLAAIRRVVFEEGAATLCELVGALGDDFVGHEDLRARLLVAPKWGNGDPDVDGLVKTITDALYDQMTHRRNPRGGRWQLALYSFVANHGLGARVGASADGRRAGESLTRNLDPTWGTDTHGPAGVLLSLARIDFTKFPNGSTLDLTFDPEVASTSAQRDKFAGFLKAFVNLGVMTMQISVTNTETLLDAQRHPDSYPHLMVKVAGYTARFVDLPPEEQAELIGRSTQRLT